VRALDELGITLLVTREYEHLVLALSAVGGRIVTSSLRVPHPSGLVVDRNVGFVYVACTRNPNQLLELRPSAGWFARQDRFIGDDPGAQGLAPYRMRFLAGCMYLHDLAIVGGRLVANAVGLNAIVDLTGDSCRAVWWPRSADHDGKLVGARNLIVAGEPSGVELRVGGIDVDGIEADLADAPAIFCT
jgi:DNA-binding beta-propeller fold protein YncE